MKTIGGWMYRGNKEKLVSKRWLLSLAVVAITIVLLYLLAGMVDIEALARKLLSIDPAYVFYFLLIEACIFAVSARRYQVVLRLVGCVLPYRRCFTVNMASYPFICILPSVSGSLVKVFYLRNESPPGKVISSVITEKLFDFGVIGLLATGGLAFYFGYPVIILAALIIVLLAVLARLEIIGRLPESGIPGKIGKVLASIIRILRDGKATLVLSSYTLIIWSLALLQIYLFFEAIGAGVSFLSVFFRMPIAMLVGQIPLTVSGMGTRDGAMLYFFNGLIGAEQILAAGFLFTVFRYWVPAAAGALFMIAENRKALAAQQDKPGREPGTSG